MQPIIGIIGAGLSGLTLARVLHRKGIETTIYEAENSPFTRHQGGLLDIHESTGQQALQEAGLYDEFLTLVRPGEDAKRVMDKDGVILFETAGNQFSPRPEVERGQLRSMLIGSLPQATIRWNHKVKSVKSIGNGRHEVTFANGTRSAVDLLVGADGAWSRIRSIVSNAEPAYTGTCFVEIGLAANDVRHAASFAALGNGTLMAVAPGKGIIAHRNADGSASGYVALNKPEQWIKSIDFSDPCIALGFIAEQFADWAPHLTTLITGSIADPTLRPIYVLPVQHEWPPRAGVTLVGDAAHLMSPFAGVGANLAMYDGAELARLIIANPSDLETALRAYETSLFSRSQHFARISAQNLSLFFGDAAPTSVAKLFHRLAAGRV